MRRDERQHLPGCECRLQACRTVLGDRYLRTAEGQPLVPSKAATLARFETLIAMRSSTVQVSRDEARVESPEGEILILRCSPIVLALLSAAERLPPPITKAGETWGAERVTGGARR